MIKNKSIIIKINPSNHKWFKERGYNVSFKEILVNIEDLKPNSTAIVDVCCDICLSEKKMKYQQYNTSASKLGYYACSKCGIIKLKETNLKKYGVECYMSTDLFKGKTKDTLIEKYGVENISKLDSIKDSRRLNFKKESTIEKLEKTNLEKYGYRNPSSSDIIKGRRKLTMLQKYNVENPTQLYEFFIKSQKSGKTLHIHENTGLNYRGTYEFHFLDYCYYNKINVINGPTIQYLDECGFSRYYHSDFYIKDFNLIIEIKSNYYYKLYEEKNVLKEQAANKLGYKFMFIINKDYSELELFFHND